MLLESSKLSNNERDKHDLGGNRERIGDGEEFENEYMYVLVTRRMISRIYELIRSKFEFKF